MSTEDIIKKIKRVISANQGDIRDNKHLAEPKLLEHIRFGESLGMLKQKGGPALFGYPSARADFVSEQSPLIVIEVKRIGFTNKNGNARNNECDIKNGLAQVLEQAFCRGAELAVFVILDGGRGADREWNEEEQAYVQMFLQNNLGVTLLVVRARFPSSGSYVQFERWPPAPESTTQNGE